MDFMNRGDRPVQQNAQGNGVSPAAPKAAGAKKGFKEGKYSGVAYVAFAAVVAILILALVAFMVTRKNPVAQTSSKVDTSKMQAVFLNGGQVYFGKITDLNARNLSLDDIYYLRVNQQVQPNQTNTNNANDISLVKLGCELHGPEDSMVINQEQVIFWENLKTDGQVAKAVADYVKNNPNGQKCEQTNATGTTNNGNSGAGSTTTTAPNTTSTGTNTTGR